MGGGMDQILTTTTILYDDDEIRVIWAPADSKIVLITFGDAITPAQDHRFFADTPLRKSGISAIGVMAKRANWYPSENLRRASQIILETIADYETRVAYGGSMGGYGAVKFSRLLAVTHVIAMCPQWSIDREECDGRDPGWQQDFLPAMRGMSIRSADVAGDVFIFADSYNAIDDFHCRKIVENYPDTHFIKVPRVDHHVTTVFAGAANLRALIDGALTRDMAELRRIARQIRKSHWRWRSRILQFAMRRFPRLAAAYLAGSDNRDLLRENWRYFPQLISHIAETDGAPRAIAFFEEFASLIPAPAEQLLIGAYLAGVTGARIAIATSHGSALVYDVSENRAIHKAGPLAPWEFLVEAEYHGAEVALLATIGGTRFPLSVTENGSLVFASKGLRESVSFELIHNESDEFAIRHRAKYLSAIPTGAVVCDRDGPYRWEMFRFRAFGAARAP
ncbi:hypothetical protein MSC49_20770 [Methylosinus sp. C49]|nr:hypothetical protein MSC49_20770 [Methylosinus sp. C49]